MTCSARLPVYALLPWYSRNAGLGLFNLQAGAVWLPWFPVMAAMLIA